MVFLIKWQVLLEKFKPHPGLAMQNKETQVLTIPVNAFLDRNIIDTIVAHAKYREIMFRPLNLIKLFNYVA